MTAEVFFWLPHAHECVCIPPHRSMNQHRKQRNGMWLCRFHSHLASQEPGMVVYTCDANTQELPAILQYIASSAVARIT